MCPGRYNLKLQADKINFENCSAGPYFKTHIAICFSLLFWPSVPSFAFGVLFKYSFTVLRGYFICLNEFNDHFLCLSLAEILDTVPLRNTCTVSTSSLGVLSCFGHGTKPG